MEQKRIKNDRELTGKGSQLNRFPQRACKVRGISYTFSLFVSILNDISNVTISVSLAR